MRNYIASSGVFTTLVGVGKDLGCIMAQIHVLYHQIDGGAENANAEFYTVAALIVASGLADKAVITRLPVEHTHEAIDGCFALICRKLPDLYVLTRARFQQLVKMRCPVRRVLPPRNFSSFRITYRPCGDVWTLIWGGLLRKGGSNSSLPLRRYLWEKTLLA